MLAVAVIIIVIAAAAILSSVLGLTGVSTAAVAGVPETVKIAYIPVVQALPLYLAVEKGYFAEAGIDAELVRIDAPNLIIDSLISDKVDFAVAAASGITAIANYRNPGKLEIFALIGGNDSTTNDLLLVRDDAGTASVTELRGKNLGILPGIQFRTIARHILAQSNMTLDDVTLVELAPAMQVQALAAGQIDALLTVEPAGTIVRTNGIGKDLIHAPMVQYISNPWYGAVGVVRSDFAKVNPQATDRVIAVFDRTMKEIRQNPDAANRYLENYTALTDDLIPDVPLPIFKMYTEFDQADVNALQKFFDIFTLYGVIDGEVDASGMIYSNHV